jgi:CheY-like chemotaxis protein
MPFRLPIRRPRGLLVEDEVSQLDRRRELLRLRDIDVITAFSRREAIERLQAIGFQVDVLLTDLNLTESNNDLDGVEVAAVLSDYSGAAVPAYAYSGKTTDLPRELQRHFIQVVLKSASIESSRRLLDAAAASANAHLQIRADRMQTILSGLGDGPRKVGDGDVRFMRDLVSGATSRFEIPEAVGVLELDDSIGIPFGMTSKIVNGHERYYASILGHEYVYGYASDPETATDTMKQAMFAYSELIEEAGSVSSIGNSKRLRRFLRSLDIEVPVS